MILFKYYNVCTMATIVFRNLDNLRFTIVAKIRITKGAAGASPHVRWMRSVRTHDRSMIPFSI